MNTLKLAMEITNCCENAIFANSQLRYLESKINRLSDEDQKLLRSSDYADCSKASSEFRSKFIDDCRGDEKLMAILNLGALTMSELVEMAVMFISGEYVIERIEQDDKKIHYSFAGRSDDKFAKYVEAFLNAEIPFANVNYQKESGKYLDANGREIDSAYLNLYNYYGRTLKGDPVFLDGMSWMPIDSIRKANSDNKCRNWELLKSYGDDKYWFNETYGTDAAMKVVEYFKYWLGDNFGKYYFNR